jgi:dienelactone hydrolase
MAWPAALCTVALGAAVTVGCAHVPAAPRVAWDVARLMQAPAWEETSVVKPLGDQSWGYAGNLNTTELRTRDAAGGSVMRAVFYEGMPYQGKRTTVFAWIGIPPHEPGQRLPGMVLVHGGGGTAYESWVRLWNARGYAAIAMDTVGNVPTVGRHPEAGPGNCGDFGETSQPITDQWPYHAVSAVILAHSLLRSLPEVDPERTAITGVSWGGFLTCITAGLDHRFRCAIPIYGCGYLADASAWIERISEQGGKGREWCSLWDPSRYLPRVQAPIHWLAGTNDAAYWMPALARSYSLVRGRRGLSLLGNMPHGHGGAGEAPLEIAAIADHYLKAGPALPEFRREKVADGVFSASYHSRQRATQFVLHYTTAKDITPASEWSALPVPEPAGDRLRCALPPGTTMAFLNAITPDGLQVSSRIHDLRRP